MLVVKNLSKKYKTKIAVKNFSMQIKQGEIVGLLGPNGAGKTTSFYMIGGLTSPTSGEIYFKGQDITRFPVYLCARLGIGYLPQEASIFRDLTVKENIMSAIEIKFKDKNIQKEKYQKIIDEFDIKHIEGSIGSVLSGGERRRVEVARMIANEPSLVLLDEPFAGVDPIAVGGIRKTIMDLKTRGISVLITDHNVLETLKIVDRAYIMYNGETISHGLPEEILKDRIVKEVYLGEEFDI